MTRESLSFSRVEWTLLFGLQRQILSSNKQHTLLPTKTQVQVQVESESAEAFVNCALDNITPRQ